jgi:hypothetical protein
VAWNVDLLSFGASARRWNRRPDPFGSVERQLSLLAETMQGRIMTASPQMRDLAHRLLAYEASAAKTSDPFESLAFRALTQAKSETSALWAVKVAADGSLQGLGEIENQTGMDKARAGEGGIILIARLLGLLRIFLGEALTLNLLSNAWPGEAFDDSNSAHGGKS